MNRKFGTIPVYLVHIIIIKSNYRKFDKIPSIQERM